jgi:hypothetical protein
MVLFSIEKRCVGCTDFIEKAVKHQIIDVAVGIADTVLSILMLYLPDYSDI